MSTAKEQTRLSVHQDLLALALRERDELNEYAQYLIEIINELGGNPRNVPLLEAPEKNK